MAAITNVAPGYWFTGGGAGYAMSSGDFANLNFRLRRELKKRGLISERATLPVLVNNAIGAGGNVNAGYNRVAASNIPANSAGNPVPAVPAIETVLLHTGPTTNADAALLTSLATFNTQPTYPKNGDGNPRGNNGG